MYTKLILVRHAEYSGGGSDPALSQEGKNQSTLLGQKIRSQIGNEKVTIWTSNASRAMETAEIIKSQLQLVESFEAKEKLWSHDATSCDLKWLRSELSNFQNEGTLIVVSHSEYVQFFPLCLGLTKNDSGYAEGIIIVGNVISRISFN